jgi:hypothetical protein
MEKKEIINIKVRRGISKPIGCYWDGNGCLISNSCGRDYDDYPYIFRDGKHWRLSRWVFYINNGYVPEIVMHTCDNPTCVNPCHLIAGNTKLNALDMVKKGRAPKGDNQFSKKRKLTVSKVKQIKKLIPTMSLQKIANRFNVSKKMILYIKQGRKWKHVTNIQRQ